MYQHLHRNSWTLEYRPPSADSYYPRFTAAPLTIHPITPPPILLTTPPHKRRRPRKGTFQEIQQQPFQPSTTSPSPLPTSPSPKPRPTSTPIPSPHSNINTKYYSTTPKNITIAQRHQPPTSILRRGYHGFHP